MSNMNQGHQNEYFDASAHAYHHQYTHALNTNALSGYELVQQQHYPSYQAHRHDSSSSSSDAPMSASSTPTTNNYHGVIVAPGQAATVEGHHGQSPYRHDSTPGSQVGSIVQHTPSEPATPIAPWPAFMDYPPFFYHQWPFATNTSEFAPPDQHLTEFYRSSSNQTVTGHPSIGVRLNPIPTMPTQKGRNTQRQISHKKGNGGRLPKEIEASTENSMTQDELAKRQKRRERNKEAAARCRQRRLDQIAMLEKEVDGMRERNHHQQLMINRLKEQKDALEQLLHNHGCKLPPEFMHQAMMNNGQNNNGYNNASQHQPVPQQHNFANPSPRKRAAVGGGRGFGQNKVAKTDTTTIKQEDPMLNDGAGRVASLESDLERPNSLQFTNAMGGPSSMTYTNPVGIPCTTPSTGFTPGCNNDIANMLLNQNTGLTPVSNNPVTISFPTVSLATPMDAGNESVMKTL